MPERRGVSRRVYRILIYSIVLAALICYGYRYHPGVTLSDCLTSPENYDGELIEVGNEAKIEDVYQGGFIIRQLGKSIPVVGTSPDVKAGEYVLLLARFHKPSSLEAVKIRIAKNRRLKIWLSAIPALLVLFYFLRRYRFDVRSLYFDER